MSTIVIGQTGTVGTVIEGIDAATGDDAIRVSAQGDRSESRLSEDGQVSLDVTGTAAVGRPGEPRVARTLCERLEADGAAVSVRAGEDQRGEDARLIIADKTFTLQIVTTPGDAVFWQQAKTGSAMSEVPTTDAVVWIRARIEGKALKIPPGQRSCTVLALDAQHAGVLANGRVIDSYLGRFGNPGDEFWFASVWVVGPTVPFCVRLGEGAP
jgi:hypothetical protein